MTTHSPAHPPPALRLATRIHDHLTRRQAKSNASLGYPLDRLSGHLQRLAAIRRHLDHCQKKGWRHAVQHLLSELHHLLAQVPADAQHVQQAMPPKCSLLSVAEIAREFEQIEDEFGGWDYQRPGLVSVVTDPITLEGIHLGSFEIQLNLERLGYGESLYEVIALDPNPAACNESVTHPHVREKELCEGDATVPIKAALSEGRLCDFFILVRSVLQTYNGHSPHVALESWTGSPCHDCSELLNDDDSHYCEGCNHDFCDSCFSYCRCCDGSYCLNCLDTCPHCQESACNGCMRDCQHCGKSCCTGCLEEGLCPNCQEPQDEPSSIASTPSTSAAPSSQSTSTPTKEPSYDQSDQSNNQYDNQVHHSRRGADVPAAGSTQGTTDRGGEDRGADRRLGIRARRRHRHRRVAA